MNAHAKVLLVIGVLSAANLALGWRVLWKALA